MAAITMGAVGCVLATGSPAWAQAGGPVRIDVEPNDLPSQVAWGAPAAQLTAGVDYEGTLGAGDAEDWFPFSVRGHSRVELQLTAVDDCAVTAGIYWLETLSDDDPGDVVRAVRVRDGATASVETDGTVGTDYYTTGMAVRVMGDPAHPGCRWRLRLGPVDGLAAGRTGMRTPPAPRVSLPAAARRGAMTVRTQLPPAVFAGATVRIWMTTHAPGGHQRLLVRRMVPRNGVVVVRVPAATGWRDVGVRVEAAPGAAGPWTTSAWRNVRRPVLPMVATATFGTQGELRRRPRVIRVGDSQCSPYIRGIRWTAWTTHRAVGVGQGIVPRWSPNISCGESLMRARTQRTIVRLTLPRECGGRPRAFTRIALSQGGRESYRHTRACD